HFVHDLHQVAFGEGIAVDPGRTASGPVAARRWAVPHAHEGEATVIADVGKRPIGTVDAAEVELPERSRSQEDDDRRDRRQGAQRSHAGLHESTMSGSKSTTSPSP